MLTDHLWEVLDLFPMLEADEYGVEKSRVTATIIDRMPSGEDKLSGPIIAERRLSVRISETEVQEVVIRMAAPERGEREDDYRCAWELVAPGYRKTFYASGADGFHAILHENDRRQSLVYRSGKGIPFHLVRIGRHRLPCISCLNFKMPTT